MYFTINVFHFLQVQVLAYFLPNFFTFINITSVPEINKTYRYIQSFTNNTIKNFPALFMHTSI